MKLLRSIIAYFGSAALAEGVSLTAPSHHDLHVEYTLVEKGERRLVDLMSGYLDPTTDLPSSEDVQVKPEDKNKENKTAIPLCCSNTV